MKSDVGWNKWIKAELLDWDTELTKFTFVSLHHVRVSFSDLLEGGLNLSNGVTLQVLYFF